jgi:hypothetical protein
LREHGRKLVSSPLDADAVNSLIDCFVLEDLGCSRAVVEHRSKAPTIIFARVEIAPGGEGMGSVTLVGYWLQKGHDPVGERRTCSHCSPQALSGTADDLMQALAAEPPPQDPNMLVTAPALVDVRDLDKGGQRSRVVPLALIGGGAALLVTGGVMLALNGEPSKTGVQSPTYRDWGPPAYTMLATGAVAVGVGAYLWFHGNHKSAPVAAVSPGGAVFGWTGRF